METLATKFRNLHVNTTPLRLPNAWDAGSARLFESVGATAIATTSAGVAWSLGYPDGNSPPVRLLADLTANIVRVIRVPLSIDVEAGYSADPTTVADNVMRIVDAGAVGINIEDGIGPPDLLARKIEAVRSAASRAGIDLFINARTDVYLADLVPKGSHVGETVSRATLYQSAGADGVFIPCLLDPKQIATVVGELTMPVNVMAWPELPNAAELGRLGVRRLSAGSGIPQMLWAKAAALARGFVETGESDPMMSEFMAHSAIQGLFADRAPSAVK